MFRVEPAAAFRGERTYYHSTDLYEAIVASLQSRGVAATGFDLKIRDRIVTQPCMEFQEGAPPGSGREPAAQGRFTAGEAVWNVRVVAGDRPITERKPYDESGIWSRTEREGDAFVARDCAGATPIEVVTATGVLAHKVLFPPPAGQRWLLGQLTGTRLLGPEELDYCRIDVVRRVGSQMTQATYADRHGVVGRMLFALK
jgi:hypothetical protein